jgi:hypothetical protein
VGRAINAILIGPVALAILVRYLTTPGAWSPIWQLWIVAVIALLGALWCVDRSEKLKAAHVAAGYVQLGEVEAEALPISIAIALGLIAEFLLVASFELWAGVGLIGLLLAWILLCFLPPLRRFEGMSSVQVACSPEAAFALVSEPQSWRLWTPELDSVESSEVPVRVGTVVHSRFRVGDRLMEGHERVVAFDPPRRCGSRVLDVHGDAFNQYDISTTDGETLIAYRLLQIYPVRQAVLGGVWNRRKSFTERWAKKMQRIKELLEDGAAGSV